MYANDQDIGSTFWPLWQQHQDYLYNCCVKWMGNVADAEDALSRAMLKAWDKIRNSPAEIKNFKAWLSQLTYNLCVDIHREHHRGGRQVESLDTIGFEEQEIASQEETPVLVATQQELENFFCLAIDKLPIRLQETFILHFKDELSYKEIAERLSISYDNVRKRISQARKILQQRYDQDFLGEDNSKSEIVSQCGLRNNSHPIQPIEVNDIEIVKSEDLDLSILEGSHQEELVAIEEVGEKPNPPRPLSLAENGGYQAALVPSPARKGLGRGKREIFYIFNHFANILLVVCLDSRKFYSPQGFKISSDTGDWLGVIVNNRMDSS